MNPSQNDIILTPSNPAAPRSSRKTFFVIIVIIISIFSIVAVFLLVSRGNVFPSADAISKKEFLELTKSHLSAISYIDDAHKGLTSTSSDLDSLLRYTKKADFDKNFTSVKEYHSRLADVQSITSVDEVTSEIFTNFKELLTSRFPVYSVVYSRLDILYNAYHGDDSSLKQYIDNLSSDSSGSHTSSSVDVDSLREGLSTFQQNVSALKVNNNAHKKHKCSRFEGSEVAVTGKCIGIFTERAKIYDYFSSHDQLLKIFPEINELKYSEEHTLLKLSLERLVFHLERTKSDEK